MAINIKLHSGPAQQERTLTRASPTLLGKALGVSRQRAHQLLHRGQLKANQLCNSALARGELIKPPTCSQCGVETIRLEHHHPDYAKPLEVVWLCIPCHKALLRGQRHSTYLGQPVGASARVCSQCGKLIAQRNKGGLCHSCSVESRKIEITCTFCGATFPIRLILYRRQIQGYITSLKENKRYKGRFFCNRRCLGFWFAANYGFGSIHETEAQRASQIQKGQLLVSSQNKPKDGQKPTS